MTNTRKVLKTVKLAMKANKKTKHDVFIHLSPHVERIGVDIHLGGWDEDINNPDLSYYGKYRDIPRGSVLTKPNESVNNIWIILKKLLEDKISCEEELRKEMGE